MFGLSFCITCRNRAEMIKKTLRQNVDVVSAYHDVEIVLLNYDSRDDLDAYVLDNFGDALASGLLAYVKTPPHEFFHMSHAKNCAHRAATKQILINLDADNYLEAAYIDELLILHVKGPMFVTRHEGRISVDRTTFQQLGGYDESMVGWGHDDNDMVQRMIQHGCEIHLIDQHVPRIEHKNRDDCFPVTQSLSHDINLRICKHNAAHKIINPNDTNGRVWGVLAADPYAQKPIDVRLVGAWQIEKLLEQIQDRWVIAANGTVTAPHNWSGYLRETVTGFTIMWYNDGGAKWDTIYYPLGRVMYGDSWNGRGTTRLVKEDDLLPTEQAHNGPVR